MARVIRKNNSTTASHKQKAERKSKFKIKIKGIHVLYGWNILASIALVIVVIFMFIKYWPKDVYVRETNSFEQAVSEYLANLSEGEDAKVEYMMAEDMSENGDLGGRYFVLSYDPDLKRSASCLEDPSVLDNPDIKMEDYKYNDVGETNMVIFNGLLADLIDVTNECNIKLYIVDLSYKANLTDIDFIGNTSETISLGDYTLYFVNEGTDSAIQLNGEGEKITKEKYNTEIKPYFFEYSYIFYGDKDCDGVAEQLHETNPAYFGGTMFTTEVNDNGLEFQFWCTQFATTQAEAVEYKWKYNENEYFPYVKETRTIELYAWYA